MTESRLPYLRRDDLDDEGRSLFDFIAESRGKGVVNDDGGLHGPFNPWLYSPELGARMGEVGRLLRFETSIERRLLELAIITVGAHWQAEFEWWAHSRMAREHGVTDEIIDAIARGETPTFAADDAAGPAVYAVARELVTDGRLTDATYESAKQHLGDRGMVELVSLCGYYTLVSYTLNAFTIPLPAGAAEQWSAS